MSNIYTHDRISLSTGVMSKTGVLFGGNAIQSITIGRHTPRNPQQAVGHLGVVDYTRGTITSDIAVECILVEATNAASANTSIYRFANQTISVGLEEYVLMGVNVGFTAGNPATVGYNYMTSSIASQMAIQAQPTPESGEESSFAVILGDNGSGLVITATGGTVGPTSTFSYLAPDGSIATASDGSIPGGLQNLSFNARINRDNVLDVRSTLPVQFVTTYPLDLTASMEIFRLPDSGDLSRIDELTIALNGLGGGGTTQLLKGISLVKVDEQETVSVGRFRGFTYSYILADIQLPIEEPPAGTLD